MLRCRTPPPLRSVVCGLFWFLFTGLWFFNCLAAVTVFLLLLHWVAFIASTIAIGNMWPPVTLSNCPSGCCCCWLKRTWASVHMVFVHVYVYMCVYVYVWRLLHDAPNSKTFHLTFFTVISLLFSLFLSCIFSCSYCWRLLLAHFSPLNSICALFLWAKAVSFTLFPVRWVLPLSGSKCITLVSVAIVALQNTQNFFLSFYLYFKC